MARFTAPVRPAGAGEAPGPDQNVPPGWSYDPSSWQERLPLVGLAMLGFGIAAYLTLYQLGVLATVFEPFFGRGSEVILHSFVSRLLPVPDAALGALGYLADAVTGVVGGRGRWRSLPWLVILFGLAVGPLGAVSITLVILQPVLFDAWCTLCLTSALISLLMIGPAMDEVLASLQYVKRAGERGESRWAAFLGRTGRFEPVQRPCPAEQVSLLQHAWPQLASSLLSLWLIASPSVLGFGDPARTSAHIAGPIALSISVVAISSVTRGVRWANLAVGLWLLAAPWLLADDPLSTLNSLAVGALLIALAAIPGPVAQRYGGGWRELFASEDRPEPSAGRVGRRVGR